MPELSVGERGRGALRVSPEHLAVVLGILERHVPGLEVRAFGSRVADGEAEESRIKKYSDLDLAIVSETPLSLRTLGMLREDFSDSDLPWRVDLVGWASVGEAFREIVEGKYVVLKERA